MKVLLACGGTGGHIFPALSFLETLKSKQKDLDALIVVTKRKIENRIIPREYRVIYISLSPVSFKFDSKNMIALIKLLGGAIQSIYIILRFHPTLVVGFGGYAAFALVFFANALGIKTIIHEQNVVVGIANKLLARFVDKIAISFDQTREYLKSYSNKIIVTGNPRCDNLVKVERGEALDFFGLSKDKFTILVMGGSQGSAKINAVFLETLSNIKDKNNLQVIHLSGSNDFNKLLDEYQKMDVSFKLFDFLRPMNYVYSAADLAISRAGATTMAELIFFGLPAIIIPYPFAYQHQIANAKLLVKNQAAILIEDRDLNVLTLRDIIVNLLNNHDRINNMRSQYEYLRRISYQQDLSDAVLSLVR